MISCSRIEHNPPLTRIQSIPSASKKGKKPKISQVTLNSSSQPTSPSISPGPMLWSTQPNIPEAPPGTMNSPTHPTSPSFTSETKPLCDPYFNPPAINGKHPVSSAKKQVIPRTPLKLVNTKPLSIPPNPNLFNNRKRTCSTASTCHHCGKVYSFKSGLSKHLRKEHSSESESKGYNITCHQCQSRQVF